MVILRVDREKLQNYVLLAGDRSPNIREGTATIWIVVSEYSLEGMGDSTVSTTYL